MQNEEDPQNEETISTPRDYQSSKITTKTVTEEEEIVEVTQETYTEYTLVPNISEDSPDRAIEAPSRRNSSMSQNKTTSLFLKKSARK